MMNLSSIKSDLEKETGLVLTNNFREELALYINHLINNNLEKLVFLLYRIDISEKKIKTLLSKSSKQNAGELIANAIIARQEEKVELRKKFTPQNIIPEEDKW